MTSCRASHSSAEKMPIAEKTSFALSELNVAAASGVVLRFGRPRFLASSGHSAE
eukprot:CAMPEP_0185910350 /NCGR_PEP_ID=MMETSP0196C-20130402/18790_1 /TAXON_ID=2932 /ORGANISM="Alexandrium fundyense, Strain CCMP1719" /LENGTH=53 /DNA_ID=CAMNT_0028631077 /DNA_START=158 /DNA_END=319 /DNA_ORIENTATION=+